MQQKLKTIEMALEICQIENRRSNLIIKGLEINTNTTENLKETIEEFIKKELQSTRINVTRKINKKTHIIEMKSFDDKINVLRAKTNLANRKGKAIQIDCYLTRIKQEMQKT